MKWPLITLFNLVLCSSPVWASTTQQCVDVDEKQIANLFDEWNTSLQSKDATKVASNYLSDAVLLPTLSNQVRFTDAERIEYFKHFLEKQPKGTINRRKIIIGCNMAVDTGIYTFTFADHSQIQARYTFTYQWDGKEWQISSHHSSIMPEKNAQPH